MSTLPSSSNSPVVVPNPPPPSDDYDVSGWEVEPDVFGKYDDSEGSEKESDSDDGEEEFDFEDSDDSDEEPEVVAAELKRKALVDVTIDPLGLYVVCIDGYYRKDRGPGGYGAILRCEDGQPIAAISGASDHGVSEFYHTLEGVRAGFQLAIQKNVKYMKIVCNTDWVYWIVGQCFSSNLEGICHAHPPGSPSHDFDEFCVTCFKMTKARADFHWNFEMMKQIVQLGKEVSFHGSYLSTVGRDWNEPADFLAKMEGNPGEVVTLKPLDFPNGLISLLSKHGGKLLFDLAFI